MTPAEAAAYRAGLEAAARVVERPPCPDTRQDVAAAIRALPVPTAVVDVVNLDLCSALDDMRGGWRYIRHRYGDLEGVGWDRCEASATAALSAARSQP